MKKILLVFLSVVFVFSIADSRPPRAKKAGKVEDGVYADRSYNFKLGVPEAWDHSIKKDDDYIRMVLVKKEYEIPMQFQHAPAYTTVPKIKVMADTLSMDVRVFVDSLMSDDYDSDQKDDILSETKILFGDFMPRKRTAMPVGETDGVYISGRQQYTIQVQRQGSASDKGDVVTDYYGGGAFFVRDPETNQLVVMNFICEDRYFAYLEKEFIEVIKSFEFTSGE